jgi:hypothetical protein
VIANTRVGSQGRSEIQDTTEMLVAAKVAEASGITEPIDLPA